MSISRLSYLGYFILLAGYAWYKYAVAAPAAFSPVYAKSVVILVAMTGVPPFLASLMTASTVRANALAAIIVGALIGAVVCVAGYALFFYFFIAPSGADVSVFDVARRGLGWGAAQGVLGGLAMIGKRRA